MPTVSFEFEILRESSLDLAFRVGYKLCRGYIHSLVLTRLWIARLGPGMHVGLPTSQGTCPCETESGMVHG